MLYLISPTSFAIQTPLFKLLGPFGYLGEIEFARSSELKEFVSRTQPDDETRHQQALLQFSAGVVWGYFSLSPTTANSHCPLFPPPYSIITAHLFYHTPLLTSPCRISNPSVRVPTLTPVA